MSDSTRTTLDLFHEFGAPVYPGHPVTLACYALISAPTIAEALVPAGPTAVTLVSAKSVMGAQDAIQAAAAMLGRLQRGESIDAALKWSNEWWARCIRQHKPAFDKRLEPGLEQAQRMEPLFRELAVAARARAAQMAAGELPHAATPTAEKAIESALPSDQEAPTT
jgi:hypothetical protein